MAILLIQTKGFLILKSISSLDLCQVLHSCLLFLKLDMLFMVTCLCFWNQIFFLNLSWADKVEKEKKSSKDKKKRWSQEVMKKARTENVREPHGLIKAQESVLSTMLLKNLLGGKINKGTFDVVWIGHIKTLDSFSPVKEGKYSHHLNAIFEAKMLIENDNKVVTVSRMQRENKLTSAIGMLFVLV